MKTDKICETCRYWSELVVRSCRRKPSLEALCLNREGPFYSLFCRGAQRCPSWARGHLGAIDDPDLPEKAYANHSSGHGCALTNSTNPSEEPSL
jgi:hypothetical protein